MSEDTTTYDSTSGGALEASGDDITAQLAAPSFKLSNLHGDTVTRTGDRPSVLCFIKEDCPTCIAVLPVLSALHNSLAEHIDVYLIGQTADGNQRMTEQYDLPFSLLDDSTLHVSYASNIEIVPTLMVTEADNQISDALVGFQRDEWQTLLQNVAGRLGTAGPTLDWDRLPLWRPGCGSLSVDPTHADRLRAEAEDSPIRARNIEIGQLDDPFEFMFDQGFTDGLPVVPPTAERVLRMLAGTRREAQEVVAVMPPNMGEVTVEKAAINAVMAGCKPEYLPVVLALVEAICTDDFNIHGVMATTMGASPVAVVNGPIRERIGMNMGIGALGQGNRANATIGRAVRLIVRNVGGATPGGTERSTLGSPLKFTMCFAEWEERSNWDPLHVERGFEREDSVVTVWAMSSGPSLIIDQESLDGDQLAGTMGKTMETIFNHKAYSHTNTLLVIPPEHVDTFARSGYTKADIRERIQTVTRRDIQDLVADETAGVGIKPELAEKMAAGAPGLQLSKFAKPEDVHIVVAGSEAGKFTGCFHGWVAGPKGSIPVSRKIEEV
ncbi:MAG TPA: thiol-disulfide oxidoreductase [Gammaproteobacteria bacterium]|nr:thiol-disulfide oxidoreductase [Gammaproteobacteria bacterium]|tara:strand:+ start:5761 stop:7416 length:1656 start_codon:yes stop_codon:yes gene_type:complete